MSIISVFKNIHTEGISSACVLCVGVCLDEGFRDVVAIKVEPVYDTLKGTKSRIDPACTLVYIPERTSQVYPAVASLSEIS